MIVVVFIELFARAVAARNFSNVINARLIIRRLLILLGNLRNGNNASAYLPPTCHPTRIGCKRWTQFFTGAKRLYVGLAARQSEMHYAVTTDLRSDNKHRSAAGEMKRASGCSRTPLLETFG
jgi:hypothetical protein